MYVADFYCHSLKLVIEIDRGIHNNSDIKINDAIRQSHIESFEIKVIRFTNEQFLKTPEIILQTISNTVKDIRDVRNSTPSGAGGLRAMIFAAGLGTRFKPWTDSHPKALALVNGKSLLQRNVEYLQQYNITDVVINVHHFKDQVIDAIKKNNGWGSNIILSDESDELLETGGGLLKAADLIKNGQPFISLNADFLTDLNINDLTFFSQTKKCPDLFWCY